MRFIILFLLISISHPLISQTYVPDAVFEQMLIDLGYDDSLDQYLNNSIIDTIDTLDISGNNFNIIHDLTGIEGFTNLQYLDCSNHKLDTLDLNNNIYLKHIKCINDSLNILMINNLNSLNILDCSFNYLEHLDLSGNPALDSLECSRNQLNSLDVSSNLYLAYLLCGNNNIQSLDLSNMVMGGVYSLRCENNAINSLKLDGNYNLNWLTCYNNDLSNIDLSYCPNIEILNLGNLFSQISNYNNDFSILDLSSNCNILSFNSSNLPNLSCIEVCNITTSTNNWNLTIDSQHYFSLDCNFTAIEEKEVKSDNLLFIRDIYGRESFREYNTVLFYFYQDGSIQKKIILE